MNFEPQKFFIGLIDFFAIIMPGAALAYLLKDMVACWLALPTPYDLGTLEKGAVFLFVSYLLGHLIALLGSPLDRWIYENLRNCTDSGQAEHLADADKKGELTSLRRLWRARFGKREVKPAPAWLRHWAKSHWLFGKNADEALKHVLRLKFASLDRLSAPKAVNAFQWSKIRLGKDHPAALLEVNRFEANSKFFRSFAVVLAILVAFYAIRGSACYAVICATLLVPALWRYINQRFKSIQQAYWSVLTVDAANAADQAKPASVAAPIYAGGVVVRTIKNSPPMCLLVTELNNNKKWVLPKGHIEVEERAQVAAIREVYEEAGCWTRIQKHLRTSSLDINRPGPVVHWFLMDLIEECDIWPEDSRERTWLSFDNAVKEATYEETKDLLRMTEELLTPQKTTFPQSAA
jgi:8-oxo-dGTP pyrophosphatase MutT (NUDIX family)